jgi:acylphosphatase
MRAGWAADAARAAPVSQRADAAEAAPPPVARRVVVHGRVHGVGFRYAMAQAARAAGVCGWVRNRRDGTVEAHVQGSPAAVQRIVEWARHGPPTARVSACDVAEAAVDDALDEFTQRSTP